jgi:bifunctional DNA-binding transcriptional regulator/antitoxin component of YhaV-PrlF toxin-antitoxin module
MAQYANCRSFAAASPHGAWKVHGIVVHFPCILTSFNRGIIMLAKVTAKNQLTLPKAVASRFPGVEHFDISTDGESIVLRPLRQSRADEVRAHLKRLGITEQDVKDAVAWARRSK